MIRNITIKSEADSVFGSEAIRIYREKVNQRLSDLAEELNQENAVVECWVLEDGGMHFTFRNISPQLHRKVLEELSRYLM